MACKGTPKKQTKPKPKPMQSKGKGWADKLK
jgi:hypothetical protein